MTYLPATRFGSHSYERHCRLYERAKEQHKYVVDPALMVDVPKESNESFKYKTLNVIHLKINVQWHAGEWFVSDVSALCVS